jgi:hypothetical protein
VLNVDRQGPISRPNDDQSVAGRIQPAVRIFLPATVPYACPVDENFKSVTSRYIHSAFDSQLQLLAISPASVGVTLAAVEANLPSGTKV